MSSEEFCALIGRENKVECKESNPIGQHKSVLISPPCDNDQPSLLIGQKKNNRVEKQCTLIGLHTCGDLASTMLKVFHKTEPIRNIISVSCCYFRMTLKSDIGETKSCCPSTQSDDEVRVGERLCCCRFTLPVLYANYECLRKKNTNIEERPYLHLDENEKEKQYGFPLSHFLHTIPVHSLKYKSFETACHFLGDYAEKLLGKIMQIRII